MGPPCVSPRALHVMCAEICRSHAQIFRASLIEIMPVSHTLNLYKGELKDSRKGEK